MRTTMRTLIATTLACALAIFASQARAQAAAAAPVIHGLLPNSGPVGSLVLIFGDGFDPTPANDAVTFNNVAAVVTFARTHILAVIVPATATTGNVVVTVANAASNAVPF